MAGDEQKSVENQPAVSLYMRALARVASSPLAVLKAEQKKLEESEKPLENEVS